MVGSSKSVAMCIKGIYVGCLVTYTRGTACSWSELGDKTSLSIIKTT
jgi:hypothetical protein